MDENTLLPLNLPAIACKKASAAFNGGCITPPAPAQTRIAIRGDGHYGRVEVMERCDENGLDFVFGLPGSAVPSDL